MISSFFSHRKKKSLSTQLKGGTRVLLLLISGIFLFLAFFSLSYHNKNATSGYQLKVLREERAQVMAEIERLDMEISDSSAINQKKEEDDISQSLLFEEEQPNQIIYLKGGK